MKRLILCCLLLLTTLLFAQDMAYHIPDAVSYEIPYEFNDSFYRRGFHDEVFFFQYQLGENNLNVNQFTLNSDMEFSELTTTVSIPITSEISSLNDLYTYFRWFPDGSFHLILSSIDKGFERGVDHGQYYNIDLTDQQFFLEYALRFLNTGELFDTVNINELYPGYYYRASSNFDKLIIASAGFNPETSRLFFQNHVYSIDTQNLEFWKNGNTVTPIIIDNYLIYHYDFSAYEVYSDELELLYTHFGASLFDNHTSQGVVTYFSGKTIFSTQSRIIGANSQATIYNINNEYLISAEPIEADQLTMITPGTYFHYAFHHDLGAMSGISTYDIDNNEWLSNISDQPMNGINFVSNSHVISYQTTGEELTTIFDSDLNIVASFEEALGDFESFNLSHKVHLFEKFGYYSAEDNAYILTELEITVSNDDAELIPNVISLENYPNPFNPETTISFSTKESGQVSLDIYNIRGQKVRTLLNDHRDAGNHKVVWNGKDDNGKSVASGVFFYRMKSGKYSSTKKMILMK